MPRLGNNYFLLKDFIQKNIASAKFFLHYILNNCQWLKTWSLVENWTMIVVLNRIYYQS